MSHEVTTRPWQKVGSDLFTLNERNYLITVDYYSNYWEIDRLDDTTAKTIINKTKAHFARHGIPDIYVSNNGPQYTSEEFQNFSNTWEFEHCTSAPGNSKANGMAESAVKTAKNLLRKAMKSKSDAYLSILYWITAIHHHKTPAIALHKNC